jgi:hypothetical protein
MNTSALEILKKNPTLIQSEFGYSPNSLAEWLNLRLHKNNDFYSVKIDSLDKNTVSRDIVFEKIIDSKVSTYECSIYILSWGGMRRTNALNAFENYQIWIPICDAIRSGKLSRTEAFDKFISLRRNSKLNGMGPAFFTKLIFFFMCRKINSGYIMDQWTARSVNLLFNEVIVKNRIINKGRNNEYVIVSDDNDSGNYEQFCLCVEKISKKLDLSPEATELSLFSEGRGRGVWRNYLKSK